jgi:iron complex transport system ATP-binding protein
MTAAIAAEGLAHDYGRGPVLAGVGVAVAAGEIVGVIGPNGSGKTTLVRLLAGVIRPVAGHVSLEGARLDALPRREIARRLAVVPQDSALEFPFTALEVVLMGRAPHLPPLAFPRARDLEIARAAMARLEVAAVEGRALAELSGGERQRVLLARALAQEPRVLLLDEPTTHLDLRHQTGIYDTLRGLAVATGVAVLSVLHDLNLAALYCDRLVLLAAGRVVAEGAPEEVLRAPILTAAYGVPVHVATNAVTGTPIVLPLPRDDDGQPRRKEKTSW